MQFEQGYIFHIYNRGNNSQRIFFEKENYLFFLKKIRKHIMPHTDILAWCLMPTHFHIMVYLKSVEIEIAGAVKLMDESTPKSSLNDSISILLRSYTRAINNQENRTGSLFQNRTKAICVTKVDGITPSWFETKCGTVINSSNADKEYPQILFDYIHHNPVKDGLVVNAADWKFSSYLDYLGKRNGKLISRKRAGEFGLKI